VELLFHKKDCRWEGRKACGANVLLTASGMELRQFMIQLTMRGVEKDEPTKPLQTLEGAGSGGIYVFVPNPHSSLESALAPDGEYTKPFLKGNIVESIEN
jgi:hypothetical protein